MSDLLQKLQDLSKNVDSIFADKIDKQFITNELKPIIDQLQAAKDRGEGYSLKDVAAALRVFRNVVIPAYAKQYTEAKVTVISGMIKGIR